MPLLVNVGLSRKASKDYQSTGVSINVTAELDQALLVKPQELQRQIDGLYYQAASALDRHAGMPAAPPAQARRPANSSAGRAASSNGQANGDNGRASAPMTASQRRAITAIAQRANIDAAVEAREFVGTDLDNLALRQASELIDHLKGFQAAGNGRGR